MSKWANLKGMRFGNLVVVERDKIKHSWVVKCDCGNVSNAKTTNLLNGKSKFCKKCAGYKRSQENITHNLTHTRIYKIWCGMMTRCNSPKAHNYARYGGRGISVCEEWWNVVNFYNWATTNGYKDGLEIDRINNYGNYCPENCRWVTRLQNANNTRWNINICIGGETHTASEWSKITGVPQNTITGRIRRGWLPEKAVTIMPNKSNKTKEFLQFVRGERK